MHKRLKGKIISIYVDKTTEQRLEALSVEMAISRSAVLRMLVGQAWKDRADTFLSAVKAFDDARSEKAIALMRACVDPAAAVSLRKED